MIFLCIGRRDIDMCCYLCHSDIEYSGGVFIGVFCCGTLGLLMGEPHPRAINRDSARVTFTGPCASTRSHDWGDMVTWLRWHGHMIEVTWSHDWGDMVTWLRWHGHMIEVTWSHDWGDMVTWLRWHGHMIEVTLSHDWGDMVTWLRWPKELWEMCHSKIYL